ncbi:MAG TPA: prevent-host-death protein, partial [Clostridiales bacterium]|nr:prevent-host-death protein [Clostridiales bacterium]
EIAKLVSILDAKIGRMNTAEIINEEDVAYKNGGRKATYEEFLELTRDSKQEDRYEYIDGEIVLLTSPKTAHQTALTELFGIYYNWFQGKKCKPMVAPYDITLRRDAENINVVQPDLMVICDLEEHLNKNDYYMGTPTLVVEILSESTWRKDMLKKTDLYMSCGVSEYWIVNPLKKDVTIYLFKDGEVEDYRMYRPTETAESFTFEGLKVDLNKIFL